MRKSAAAFTLLEMLAAVMVVVILTALSFPVYQRILPAAERVVCMGNLRNLHAAFAEYAQEGWPQIPNEIPLGSREEERWWLEESEKNLKLSKKTWICPTIARDVRSMPEADRPLIHYLPTPFSKEPNRASSSPQMPWFIEIANAHGEGNLMVRANGTVEPASN